MAQQQVILIARLRDYRSFSEALASGYGCQREFVITKLQQMNEPIMELKKEKLKAACDGFLKTLDEGKVTDKVIEEFKSTLDMLIKHGDFLNVSIALMLMDKQEIHKQLPSLRPMSLVDEARKKTEERDKSAVRLAIEAYGRMEFDRLEAELIKSRTEQKEEDILATARQNVHEYCCLYKIPLGEDDTLNPFSLSRIDAVIAASYALLEKINFIMGRV